MIRRSFTAALAALLLTTSAADGQTLLTLTDAIDQAWDASSAARLAAAGERAAVARLARARAGYLPQVDLAEGWQRGDQPVFVFGALLAQRRFTEANFAVEALNHPPAIDNHRASLMVRQLVWDGGSREAAVQEARLGRDLAAVDRERTTDDLEVQVTALYGAVLAREADAHAAAAAVEAAEADLARARDRRQAGLITEADVLALDVHRARMQERRIEAGLEAEVARMRLNELIGAPLDRTFLLEPASDPPAEPGAGSGVTAEGPEVRAAALQEQIARQAARVARAAFLPQVALVGGWEWNGADFNDRASAWLVGAEVSVNLFRGGADRARAAEAAAAQDRARVEREQIERAMRVAVEEARARLEAARARATVARTSVAQARESERIVRDRYENGLEDVAALLRAAEALVASEARATSARVDVLVGAAQLRRAMGR